MDRKLMIKQTKYGFNREHDLNTLTNIANLSNAIIISSILPIKYKLVVTTENNIALLNLEK